MAYHRFNWELEMEHIVVVRRRRYASQWVAERVLKFEFFCISIWNWSILWSKGKVMCFDMVLHNLGDMCEQRRTKMMKEVNFIFTNLQPSGF